MSNLIPAHEAALSFGIATGDNLAADAYLPAAYATCRKCDDMVPHAHPVKEMISQAELATAIANYVGDKHAEDYDY